MLIPRLFSVALLLVWSLAAAARPLPQHTMDWQALADAVVKRLSLEPAEEVVLVAHPDKFQAAECGRCQPRLDSLFWVWRRCGALGYRQLRKVTP
ncbi:MAG: hypothetical protein V3R81_10945 [Gammaproteobacteria bacterium]